MKQISQLINHAGEVTFSDWYDNYPKRANRKKAETLWNKLSDKDKHDAIVDIPERLKRHSQWQDKQYIPAPDVYLRNHKWTDDIIEARTKADEQEALEDGSNLSRFWTLLKQTYGDDRVKRQYGETMPWLWNKALNGISKKEIGRIINYLMNDKDQNLPSLTRIQAIRRIGRGNEFKALPKTTSTREVALDALRQARELL
ncbi:MAG: hypothetical protein GY928_00290 [Colwellia sp.]|nr:hypothetical protein [Colwellia sp.]